MVNAGEQYDRKLRPVYDALEARNYKNALKLTAGVLKKYKGDQTVRLLQAWAQSGLGKTDAANQAVDAVLAEAPCDTQVLSVLEYVLQQLKRSADYSQAIMAASNAQPKDPELMRALFDLYLKASDFVKAQAVALKLSKLHAANACQVLSNRCIWTVIALIMLQARHPCPGTILPRAKLHQLAESMASKQLTLIQNSSDEVPTYEQLQLWLLILKDQGKHSEAAAAVAGPLGRAIKSAVERLVVQADFVMLANDPAAARQLAKQALTTDAGDWQSLYLFLHSSSQLLQQAGTPLSTAQKTNGMANGGLYASHKYVAKAQSPGDASEDRVSGLTQATGSLSQVNLTGEELQAAEATWQETESVVQSLLDRADPALAPEKLRSWEAAESTHEIIPADARHRSGLLPRVELAARRASHAQASTSATSDEPAEHAGQRSIAEAVLMYYRALGHLPQCYYDVRRFLGFVSGTPAGKWLVREVMTTINTAKAQESFKDVCLALSRLQGVRYHICGLQIAQGISTQYADAQTALGAAKHLIKMYVLYMDLAAGLDERERGPTDDLVSLAVAAIIDAVRHDGAHGHEYLTAAYLMLEAAQVRRKVSKELRLAATAVAGLLGSPRLAQEQFDHLDVKSIQLSSVACHYLYPFLQSASATEQSLKFETNIFKLHHDHTRNGSSSLKDSFVHGSFSKAMEFEVLRVRLAHCHALALAQHQHALSMLLNHSVAQSMAAVDAALLLEPEELQFPEDLSVRPTWLAPFSIGPPTVLAFHWWQQLGQGRAAANGSVWWHVAGDLKDRAMAVYQAKACSVIRMMRLQIKLTLACSRESAVRLDAADVQLLAELLAVDLAHVQPLSDDSARGNSAFDPAEQTAYLQGLAMQAAYAFQVLSVPDQASAEGRSEICTRLQQSVQGIQQHFAALCTWAADGLTLPASNGSVPAESALAEHGASATLGAGQWTWAGIVLSQAAAWIAPCLQAWLPSVSAVTAAMPEEGAQLVQCMRSAGEAFLQGLMRLSLALGTRLDALKQLQGSAAYLSGHQLASVWEWEKDFNTKKAYQRLFGDQVQTLEAFQRQADSFSKRCLAARQ